MTNVVPGTVLPLAGDWPLVESNHANGTIALDVPQTFATDDRAITQVSGTGSSRHDGSAYVCLIFEMRSKKYYWINSVAASVSELTVQSLLTDIRSVRTPKGATLKVRARRRAGRRAYSQIISFS